LRPLRGYWTFVFEVAKLPSEKIIRLAVSAGSRGVVSSRILSVMGGSGAASLTGEAVYSA